MATDLNSDNIYLKTIYNDPENSASYSSVSKLYKKTIEDGRYMLQNKIKKWLETQSIYTGFKELKRKFKTQKVYVPHAGYLWDIDVCDMTKYSKFNKYNYFVLFIDIMTR